jgi:hypothetical protein
MTPQLQVRRPFRRRVASATGQSVMEMAMLLPFLTVVALGVVELSYGLLDQHIVTRLTREGANLISRDTTLDDAYQALVGMSALPVDFNTRSKVIFSVVLHDATTGASNYDKNILYQQFQYGSSGVPGSSSLSCAAGASAFGPGPEHLAANADNNTALQVVGLPPGTLTSLGSYLYVTEIFTQHNLLTPFNSFGVTVPSTLYSIAYF